MPHGALTWNVMGDRDKQEGVEARVADLRMCPPSLPMPHTEPAYTAASGASSLPIIMYSGSGRDTCATAWQSTRAEPYSGFHAPPADMRVHWLPAPGTHL